MKGENQSEGRSATVGREEVSTATWIPFFNGFNDRFNGRRGRVEVIRPDGSRQTVFKESVVQSVATTLGTPGTTSGVDVRAPNSISITVLQQPAGGLLTHKVDGVTRVYSWDDSSRNEQGLEIETEEGIRTLLIFRR